MAKLLAEEDALMAQERDREERLEKYERKLRIAKRKQRWDKVGKIEATIAKLKSSLNEPPASPGGAAAFKPRHRPPLVAEGEDEGARGFAHEDLAGVEPFTRELRPPHLEVGAERRVERAREQRRRLEEQPRGARTVEAELLL